MDEAELAAARERLAALKGSIRKATAMLVFYAIMGVGWLTLLVLTSLSTGATQIGCATGAIVGVVLWVEQGRQMEGQIAKMNSLVRDKD